MELFLIIKNLTTFVVLKKRFELNLFYKTI